MLLNKKGCYLLTAFFTYKNFIIQTALLLYSKILLTKILDYKMTILSVKAEDKQHNVKELCHI